MNSTNISDYTEAEFLELTTKICNADYSTEKEHIDAILFFKKLTEHPLGSDLIYYASDEESTPEAIIEKVKDWRAANGKPGFKTE